MQPHTPHNPSLSAVMLVSALSRRSLCLLLPAALLLLVVFQSTAAQLQSPSVNNPTASPPLAITSTDLSTVADSTSASAALAAYVPYWLGSYSPVPSQCTPSAVCCCSNGQPMTVTASTSTLASSSLPADSLSLQGGSDGGSGCYYQSSLGGVMTLQTANLASVSYPALGLNVSAQLSTDWRTLTIMSSKTTCAVVFQRSAATPPPSTPSPSAGGGWSPPSFVYTSTAASAVSSSSTTSGVRYQSRLLPLVSPAMSTVAGSHQYVVAFGVPRSTPVSSVFFHFASTSSPATQSVSLALQSSSSISFNDMSQPLYTFVYSPLTLADTDTLTYAFSFVYSSQSQFSTFTTFVYNSTLPPPPDPTVSSSASSAPSIAPASSGPSLFVGQYRVVAGCVPSSVCCCGTGVIDIGPSADSSALAVTGALDGGVGCYGQAQLSGSFTPSASSPLLLSSSFTAQGVTDSFSVALSSPQQLPMPAAALSSLSGAQLAAVESAYNVLTVTNTMQPMCATTAVRVVNPTAVIPVNSASASQLPFIGTYQFDGSCQTSAACCCAVGVMSVAPAVSTSSVVVSGALDGSSACFGQSSLAELFSITSPITASFSMPPVNLTATMVHGSSGGVAGVDGNTGLTFVNNIYPACTSTAYRTSLSLPPTTTPPTTMPPALLTADAALLGSYQSDGSCVPSPQCCCADGVTRIERGTGGTGVVVRTVLDGVLLSCMNQDGPAVLNFSLVDGRHASGVFQSVVFDAVWESDGSLVISNSLHPTCPTRLVSAMSNDGASVRLTIGGVAAAAVWYVLVVWIG